MSLPTKASDAAFMPALSGAIVALSIALFISKGPFDAKYLSTPVTMIVVVIAYGWMAQRSPLQSIAFAAVLALLCIPIGGFIGEAFISPDPLRFITLRYDLTCSDIKSIWYARYCIGDDRLKDTQVTDWYLFIVWLASLTLWFAGDALTQKRRARNRAQPIAPSN